MLIDLHLHTTYGSSDSSLSPEDLVEETKRLGLDGLCLTEHDRLWDPYDLEALRQRHGFLILGGMEVTTELGHILVYGLRRYTRGLFDIEDLRRSVREQGAIMVAAHSFRYQLAALRSSLRHNPKPKNLLEAARAWRLFALVDAVETLNGATSPEENALARQVAEELELPTTGGSDAHSLSGIGCCLTRFERPIASEADFLQELRAGRFCAAPGPGIDEESPGPA